MIILEYYLLFQGEISKKLPIMKYKDIPILIIITTKHFHQYPNN